ncbi:MAG: hypothetical protein PF590_07050 [Candidatus Delongbacteria bacterium]|nr:hypothetical protein [Candidatus Delongbacteria bacterium]
MHKSEKETKESRSGAEKFKNITPEQFGRKALKAIQNEDVETLKTMVSAAMAVNIDKEFIKDEKEKHLQNWDGTVKGVKYRKDQMIGQLQALIYYADKKSESEGESDVILIHVLEKSNEYWHALGGPWGFEEMSKTDFLTYPESIDALE